MEEEMPKKSPQIHRKYTANPPGYTANVVNNYYENDTVEVSISVWDLLGLAILVGSIFLLAGLAVWGLWQVGLLAQVLWEWLAQNRKTIGVGLAVVVVVGGMALWWFLTYSKNENENDFV